jgi:pyruvate carboxylase
VDEVIKEFLRQNPGSSSHRILQFYLYASRKNRGEERVAIDALVQSGKRAEAAICYTGDILDPKRDKYSSIM